MKYWFTSDTHFGHRNIIRYTGRPFSSAGRMDKEIVRRWNKKVKPGDVVFHLGDLCFKKSIDYFRKILNGYIILIKGNHDNGNLLIESMTLRYKEYHFKLVHRPEYADTEYNLVGHVHEKWKVKKEGKKILINVGVDVWNFYPIDIYTIIKTIKEAK